MTVKILTSGETTLLRRLNRLGDALAGQGIARATLAGGYVSETYAKRDAPVDTGFHRSTIRAELKETGRTRAVVDVSFATEYGIYLELGTSKMSARPHLRPSVENHVPEIVNAAATTLTRFIYQASVS